RDTGSAEVQIALLTRRINDLSEHFKTHSKDPLQARPAEDGREAEKAARIHPPPRCGEVSSPDRATGNQAVRLGGGRSAPPSHLEGGRPKHQRPPARVGGEAVSFRSRAARKR